MKENEYIEMIFKAIKNNEFDSFLRGDDEYTLQPSQYAPGAEPTDVGKKLSKIIYKAYKIDENVKDKLELSLYEMLRQSDYDVYIVILYVMSELFKEQNGLSPFVMNMDNILKQLIIELKNRETGIKRGIIYPNGFVKKSAWDELIRFRKVCEEEYGITLF